MDKNELDLAYATLGLDNTASKEDVEKKYELLLRRERARKQQAGENDANGDSEFEAVHRAYRYILQYEERKDVETIQAETYGKYKRYAGLAAKLDHFFSYYRWHLVGAIAAVLLVIYGITSYIDHREEQARLAALPPSDLELMLIGRFYPPSSDSPLDAVEAAIVASQPGWQRVEAELLTLDMSEQGMADVAMQQKAMVMLATERPDVYVLDRDTFQWISRSGALEPLDADVAGRLAGIVPESAWVKAPEPTDEPLAEDAAPAADAPEHVYGIDIGETALGDSLPLVFDDLIVGIRVEAERRENALQWIERAFSANP